MRGNIELSCKAYQALATSLKNKTLLLNYYYLHSLKYKQVTTLRQCTTIPLSQ